MGGAKWELTAKVLPVFVSGVRVATGGPGAAVDVGWDYGWLAAGRAGVLFVALGRDGGLLRRDVALP